MIHARNPESHAGILAHLLVPTPIGEAAGECQSYVLGIE